MHFPFRCTCQIEGVAVAITVFPCFGCMQITRFLNPFVPRLRDTSILYSLCSFIFQIQPSVYHSIDYFITRSVLFPSPPWSSTSSKCTGRAGPFISPAGLAPREKLFPLQLQQKRNNRQSRLVANKRPFPSQE